MHVKTTEVNPTKVTVTVQLNAKELKPVKEDVVMRLGKDVKVSGFRAGKAPIAVIEKNLDESLLQSEVMEEAVNQSYVQVLGEEKLRPVAQPEVAIKKFVPFTDLEFELTIEVVGKMTLPDYKKMKVAKPKVSVTAEDIKEVLKSISEQMAEKKEVTRAAKNGDQVELDFKGTDSKGEAVQGAEGKSYPLTLGSNSFIPGFEDNLIGLKPNVDKTFDIVFPKDYSVSALANKKVTFEVKLTKIEELDAPKIDDKLAKKAGPFKNLDELKADIKKQLTLERENQAERDMENKLVQNIADKSKVAIPDVMIEEQLDLAEQEERQNLAYRGQTWEEHLKEEGVTEEEHRSRNRETAEQRVKGGLVLSEIAEREGLDVTPKELDERIETLRAQYQDPAMQAELDKPENRRSVAMRVLTEKTLAKLTEYASKK